MRYSSNIFLKGQGQERFQESYTNIGKKKKWRISAIHIILYDRSIAQGMLGRSSTSK